MRQMTILSTFSIYKAFIHHLKVSGSLSVRPIKFGRINHHISKNIHFQIVYFKCLFLGMATVNQGRFLLITTSFEMFTDHMYHNGS